MSLTSAPTPHALSYDGRVSFLYSLSVSSTASISLPMSFLCPSRLLPMLLCRSLDFLHRSPYVALSFPGRSYATRVSFLCSFSVPSTSSVALPMSTMSTASPSYDRSPFLRLPPSLSLCQLCQPRLLPVLLCRSLDFSIALPLSLCRSLVVPMSTASPSYARSLFA